MGEKTTNQSESFRCDELIKARNLAGLTNAAIAKETRLPESVVSRTLRGLSKHPRSIKRIAAFLGVPMSEIIVQPEGATK